MTANTDANLGWSFTVNNVTNVGHLGFFDLDSDGLDDSHQVGLWLDDGTLLRQTTVQAGHMTMDQLARLNIDHVTIAGPDLKELETADILAMIEATEALLATTFKELGIDQARISCVWLTRNDCIVGQLFECGPLRAVWLFDEKAVKFYDQDGKLLRVSESATTTGKAAYSLHFLLEAKKESAFHQAM